MGVLRFGGKLEHRLFSHQTYFLSILKTLFAHKVQVLQLHFNRLDGDTLATVTVTSRL
jgi:hypothetical protein